jgi:cytochrome c-type biogenesis protein CcmH/NrfG
MSFINCARSLWLRRASAFAIALVPLAAAEAAPAERPRGGDVEQAWFRLAQGLDRPAPESLKERADELLYTAGKAGLKRLPPLALALVAQARTLTPAAATPLLVQATRLDPGSAEASFALAENRLRQISLLSGFSALFRGVYTLLSDRRLQAFVQPSALLAVQASLFVVLALWGAVAVLKVLPRLWHDLTEIGGHWRLGSNAPVLGLFVIALPLFAGGDPVWLVLWMFALAWAYLPVGQRAIGAVALLVVAASPVLVETGFLSITHPQNVILQATEALADKCYEPQLLDELNALDDVLGDDADFHRLVGDCYRQFGLLDQALFSYREGLRVGPRNSALSLALGTVYYLEADYNAALQAFQAARDAGYDPVVANYNLSLTYAQTYHFKESDEAMAAARQAGERGLQALAKERDHDIILPAFRREEAVAMLGRKDPLLLLNRGLVAPPLARERTLMHPLTIGGLLALLLAVAHFLVRQHAGGFATACLKCGRPFCRHCKLSNESQSYCTQCINIFLKKDMVGIDAQLAKRRQLARHQRWLRFERRIADLALPGLGVAWAGSPVLGWLLAVVAFAAGSAGFVWLPIYVSPALMGVPMWPLMTLCGLVWASTAVVAQLLLPGEWR